MSTKENELEAATRKVAELNQFNRTTQELINQVLTNLALNKGKGPIPPHLPRHSRFGGCSGPLK